MSERRRATPSEIDKLVRDYAKSDWSDTFVSYNDAINLAGEVMRLRRVVARLRRKPTP